MTKNDRLILGMLLGGISVFIVMTIISLSTNGKKKSATEETGRPIPSRYDALQAAPGFHRLIYEDSQARILELILAPGQATPPFNHTAGTIEWIASGTPVVITSYRHEEGRLAPVSSDTISLRNDELNRSEKRNVSSIQSFTNIGTVPFRQYRLEINPSK